MTLKQAQKLYEDSIQAKMAHADNCMTQSQLEYIGRTIWGFTPDKQAKVLFTKIGKRVSTVIASKEAFIKEVGKPVVCKCPVCDMYYLAYRKPVDAHDELTAQCPKCDSLGCDSDIVHLETNRKFWLNDQITKILVPNKDPERVVTMYDSAAEDFPAQYDMLLPDGKRCSDCVKSNTCCNVFGQKESDTTCQWHPSRYLPKE